MSRDFDDILSTCLDRMSKGDTVQSCLDDYPDQAEYLEPLLTTALATKQAFSTVEPRGEFDRLARFRFQSALENSTGNKRSKYTGWSVLRRGWVLLVAVVLVLLVSGGGTVAASTDSLPGDTLYPVKRAVEDVRGFFTFGDEAKAAYYIELGKKRLQEMELLEAKNRVIPDSLLNVMNANSERAIYILEKKQQIKEEVVSKLIELTANQKIALERSEQKAPTTARERFREAIDRSQTSLESAVSLKKMAPKLRQNSVPQEWLKPKPKSTVSGELVEP